MPLEITPVVRLVRVLVEIDFGCFDSQINEGTGTKIREIGKLCFYRCLEPLNRVFYYRSLIGGKNRASLGNRWDVNLDAKILDTACKLRKLYNKYLAANKSRWIHNKNSET